MATHGVFIASRMQSQNVDALNRNAVSESNLDNGMAVVLGALSNEADKSQVFVATLPTGATAKGLWIVDEPAEPHAYDELGEEYSVGAKDPRKFYIPAGKVFAVRKPQVGDIFKISADMISGEANNFINVANTGKYAFAEAQGTGFAAKVIENSYISIGVVSTDLSQRIDAYLIEVLAN